MAEEVGLIVRARVLPDKRGLDRVAKETTKATNTATANLKKSINTMLPKSLQGMFSGGTKGFSAAGGFGGMKGAAVSGLVGGIAAGAVQEIPKLLHKMLGFLTESSASLRHVMKLLNQGFLQILRPIGDTLALLFRPVAMFFRVIGREIMRRVRAKRNELKAQGLTGSALGLALLEEMPGIYLDVFIEQLEKVNWAALFAAVGNFVWTMLTEKFPQFLEKLKSTGGLILIAIIAAIGVMAVLGTLGGLVLTAMLLGIGPMSVLGGLGATISSRALTSVGSMSALSGLASKIASLALVAAATDYVNDPEGVGKTYNELLGGGLPAGSPPLPDNDTIAGGIGPNNLVGARWQKPFEDIYNWMGGRGPLIPGLASGGEVLTTGLVNMHKGEVAQNKGELLRDIKNAVVEAGVGSGLPIQLNLSLPAGALTDAIDRRVDLYFRTKVVARR